MEVFYKPEGYSTVSPYLVANRVNVKPAQEPIEKSKQRR
jgi:hypothetical protein